MGPTRLGSWLTTLDPLQLAVGSWQLALVTTHFRAPSTEARLSHLFPAQRHSLSFIHSFRITPLSLSLSTSPLHDPTARTSPWRHSVARNAPGTDSLSDLHGPRRRHNIFTTRTTHPWS